MPETVHHYPPDLFAAPSEAIPLICRSKRDVLVFFRGAGVDQAYIDRHEEALRRDPEFVKKHIVTKALLKLINDMSGDTWLRVRREIVKRVVEFENFEAAWPEQQSAARGAVARVRELRNKKDAFTRMQDERDREHREALAEKERKLAADREHAARRESLRKDFARLFTMTNPHERGRAFEILMNALFNFENIAVRDSFTLRVEGVGAVEQIDGVIEISGDFYLVEAKWWAEKLSTEDVSHHMVRVHSRGQTRGICIVEPGYTDAAILAVQRSLVVAPFILTTIGEFYRFFEAGQSIEAWLKRKITAAILDRNPYHTDAPPS